MAPAYHKIGVDQCRRQPHYTTGEKATGLDLPAVCEREDRAKEFDLAHFGGAEFILNRSLSSSGRLQRGFEKRGALATWGNFQDWCGQGEKNMQIGLPRADSQRPYSCRLYDDEQRKCAFGSYDARTVERLKHSCLRDGGRL